MDLHVWLAYFTAAWLIALSPGAGAALSMTHGLTYGVRQTTTTILGLQAGLAFILLLAGGGVGALLLASATAFAVIKILGAAYLIWLGIKQWRADTSDTSQHEDAVPGNVSLSSRQRFTQGLLTNATNPKGIVFMVAVLPQFIVPNRALWLQLTILLVTTLFADIIVMHGYAFLAASLRRWMASQRAARTRNRITGGVLMAMGANLIFVNRAVNTAQQTV
jgi:homoserine/homoserine lactone efflux protein